MIQIQTRTTGTTTATIQIRQQEAAPDSSVSNAGVTSQNVDDWITVHGNHIKLRPGETKADAVKRFVASKEKYNKIKYTPLKLPKREYGRVIHELNNNLTKEEMKKKITKRLIGDYIYRVKIKGFNDYIIFERKLFNDISKES